jgi:RNA polymerase sigma-70 factor (ECF subfamily)
VIIMTRMIRHRSSDPAELPECLRVSGTPLAGAALHEPALDLIRDGDVRGAATLVIREHGPAVLNYLRAVLRDEDLAADAFSLFAEWTWTAIDRFRGASSIRTWAFGVAHNAARRVRDEAWQRRRKRLRTGEASRIALDIRTRSAVRREREAEELAELRKHLTTEEQNLLVLRVELELDWNEIAEIVSSDGEPATAAALRKRFERVKDRIGRLARERGLVR